MVRKRKITAVIGAVMSFMLFFTALPAHAAEKTASQADKCSITIHKFGLDNISDAKEAAPGYELTTEEEKNKYLPQNAKPLANVEFTICKLQDGSKLLDNVTKASEIDKDTNQDMFTDFKVSLSTDASGIAQFNNLDAGVYYVEETPNKTVKACEPFLVVLPMEDPRNPGSFMKNVHVYPKNQTSSVNIEKYVTEVGCVDDTASADDLIKWIIQPSIPAGIEESLKYIVTDTIDSRLVYNSFLGVSFKDKNGKTVTLIEDKNDAKYSDYTVENAGQNLTVTFTDKGRKALSKGNAGDKITITFNTKFNMDKIKDDGKGNGSLGKAIPNTAKLEYENKVGQKFTPESNTPEVHTGGVQIEKVDYDDTTLPLEGAKFKIYKTKDDIANHNAIKDSNGDDMEVTTDKDGKAVFYGLAYGEKKDAADGGSTEYWIVETQAPYYMLGNEKRSYNLLTTPVKVIVDSHSHETVRYTIKNKKFSLPITGGRGSVIFILTGIALMAGAAAVYMSNKKKTAR